MRTSVVKNGLVMVVILLFIGIAVQPSIAVNPNSSDNEEDCDICPKVSKSHIVVLKSLINRAETLYNKLSVVSKLNPIVSQKYQDLSDRITTLKTMNKELKLDIPWKYPIICNILFDLALPFFIIEERIISPIWESLEEQSLIWWLMVPFLYIGLIAGLSWTVLMITLCIEFP